MLRWATHTHPPESFSLRAHREDRQEGHTGGETGGHAGGETGGQAGGKTGRHTRRRTYRRKNKRTHRREDIQEEKQVDTQEGVHTGGSLAAAQDSKDISSTFSCVSMFLEFNL